MLLYVKQTPQHLYAPVDDLNVMIPVFGLCTLNAQFLFAQ